MSAELGLNPALLQAAFPFHLAVDRELIVVQAGTSLRRLFARQLIGESMTALFEVATPKVPVTFEMLARSPRSLFLLRSCMHPDLALRGQILHDADDDVLIFVGSPWVT